MRNYFKFPAFFIVTACFFSAIAGSYDDFFVAVKRDKGSDIRELLERGFDANTPNSEGLDGLYLSLRDDAPKVARVLADWPKTDIDRRSPKDETPLMIACLRGNVEMARKLLARGADVNKTGWTPLHYAATGGHVALIELLLDKDAYIDAESPNGTTPLMMAAMYGSSDAVHLLLRSGADPTIRNQLKLSAADFAGRAGRGDLVEALNAAAKAFAARYRK